MKISRDVIVDLLPLYLANEASEATRALVEQFLADDPALARLVEQSGQSSRWKEEVPVPLEKEQELIAFEKTRQLLFQQKLFLALAVATTLLLLAVRGDENGIEWLWLNSPAMAWAIIIVSGIFWTAFLNAAYLLNRK